MELLKTIETCDIIFGYFIIGVIFSLINVIYIIFKEDFKDFLMPVAISNIVLWPMFPFYIIVYMVVVCDDKKEKDKQHKNNLYYANKFRN